MVGGSPIFAFISNRGRGPSTYKCNAATSNCPYCARNWSKAPAPGNLSRPVSVSGVSLPRSSINASLSVPGRSTSSYSSSLWESLSRYKRRVNRSILSSWYSIASRMRDMRASHRLPNSPAIKVMMAPPRKYNRGNSPPTIRYQQASNITAAILPPKAP